MKLLTFKTEPRSSGGRTRTVLDLSIGRSGFSFGVHVEVSHEDWDGTHWRLVSIPFAANITPHFDIGEEHIYYDGPHCSFSLGYLHLCWEGDPRTGWCEKCYPPPDSDCFHGKCNHRYHKAGD